MSNVFPRHCKASPPVAVQGDGIYIVDHNGKRYLDGSGGAAVSCLGHSNSRVIEAIKAQLDRLAFAHTGFFSSAPAEALAELLIDQAPGTLDRVYFVSGGSEAVEAALKLARQYCIESGQASRHRVIARQQSYHGNTLGALAAGGNMWRREPFAPLMIDTTHISPCYAYRGQQDGESEFDYGQRVANELETEILRLGADQVMAFIAEPVVGATLGAVAPVEGYFRRIREICDQYGVLLILDEVMCGMGRTGSLFACEQDEVAPDIMTIAKGLGAGYQAIGAMLCTDRIYQAIEEGSGFFQHGHTYIGHPAACAGGLAVVSEILEQGLDRPGQEAGAQATRRLAGALSANIPISAIFAVAACLSVWSSSAIATPKRRSPPNRVSIANSSRRPSAAGLICYPMGGTIDGRQGDHVLLAPPFIIDDSQIDELVDKLDQALVTTLAACS